MCSYKEILITQKIFKKYKTHIFTLYLAYPTETKDKNLNCIPEMKKF